MSSSNTDWADITISDQGIPEVTAEWVSERSDSGDFMLLDVREDDEITGPLGSIAGHTHVPMGQVSAEAADWDRAQAIVVYCRSGGRSGRIANVLTQMGFTKVARHRSKDVELWRQGGINLITNYEPGSPA
ncbi:MAG: rhodanese-like domain-containing protein, partial [Myxococcota bacterium]